MQIYDTLLVIAGAVGAITTIIMFVKKVTKLVKKCIAFFTDMSKGVERLTEDQKQCKGELASLNAKTEKMGKQVEVIERHSRENYMRELQIIIMSEEMPIEERLRAGEEYINHGGNGAIKAKYRVLLQKYNDEQAHEQNNK